MKNLWSIKLRIEFCRQWRGKPVSAVEGQVISQKTANLRKHSVMHAIKEGILPLFASEYHIEKFFSVQGVPGCSQWMYRKMNRVQDNQEASSSSEKYVLHNIGSHSTNLVHVQV